MVETNEQKKTVLAQASEDAMVVDTMGGRVHVRWDETAQATPHGQIVFFAEFLATWSDRPADPAAGALDARVIAAFGFTASSCTYCRGHHH